jgi:hypothetical protein
MLSILFGENYGLQICRASVSDANRKMTFRLEQGTAVFQPPI